MWVKGTTSCCVLVEYVKDNEKSNKQCLFDTPRTVMVNKEMMSEYQDHKINHVCPIKAQS